MQTTIKTAEEKMEKTLDVLIREFGSIRAGRANPSVLDKISVDYYGCPTPVNQLAAVSVAEARVLQIQPYDASTLKLIEKAILVSDIGINPQNDGRVIRLAFPPLTEERRRELAKEISKLCENCKVAIRSIRRDGIEKMKTAVKDGLSEDLEKDAEATLQKIHDKMVKKVEELLAEKSKEIMTV